MTRLSRIFSPNLKPRMALAASIGNFRNLVSLSLLMFCIQAYSLPYEVEKYRAIGNFFNLNESWRNAEVYLPGSIFKRRIDTVDETTRFPVVVFIHGCTGITEQERGWARLIKGLGFAVVIPDSMAIPGRVLNCDTASYTRNLNRLPMGALRPAEVDYVLSKVYEQPWVDKKNIFLMGHSEGGYAVTVVLNEKEIPLRGIIISGYDCNFGVRASLDTALLAIEWSDDPFYPQKRYSFHHSQETSRARCKDRWGVSRPNTAHVLLNGKGHDTYWNSEARGAVSRFLKEKHSQ
jgi:dienelactone hydrolase